MTHETIQDVTSNREAHPVSRSFIGPLTLERTQELVTLAEERNFLGILATDLVVSIAVTDDPVQKRRVMSNFFENVDRYTAGYSDDQRHEFALELIENAKEAIDMTLVARLREQKELPLSERSYSHDTPTTAELEAHIEYVTDESVSPARGITLLGSTVVQRYVVEAIKRGWDYFTTPTGIDESNHAHPEPRIEIMR